MCTRDLVLSFCGDMFSSANVVEVVQFYQRISKLVQRLKAEFVVTSYLVDGPS